jgi:hypothetical protein
MDNDKRDYWDSIALARTQKSEDPRISCFCHGWKQFMLEEYIRSHKSEDYSVSVYKEMIEKQFAETRFN